jgi:hypothetical protein
LKVNDLQQGHLDLIELRGALVGQRFLELRQVLLQETGPQNRRVARILSK